MSSYLRLIYRTFLSRNRIIRHLLLSFLIGFILVTCSSSESENEEDTMIDLDTAAIQIDSEQVDIPNASEPALRDDTDIKTPTEVGQGRRIPRSQNDNKNFADSFGSAAEAQ